MKCLSIQQPYASAIIDRVKVIEFRSWSTEFRGRFAIHASQTIDKTSTLYDPTRKYHTGQVLGTVELYDVRDVSEFEGKPAFEWLLQHPLKTAKPLTMKGKLRLFELPNDILIYLTVG
jgi:hypothetical protein